MDSIVAFFETYHPFRHLAVAILILVLGMRLARFVSRWIERAMTRAQIEPTATRFVANISHIVLVAVVVRHKVHSEAVPVHLVVWDLSSTPYIDVVGARMLADLEEAWAKQGMQLRLAEARADVRDILRAEGLEARVSRIDRRTSVDDIVAAFRPVS